MGKTTSSKAGRHVELLLALNASAASIQESARSEENVFRVFKEQIAALGLRGGISLLDETGEELCARTVAFPEATLSELEKAIGRPTEALSFRLADVDMYRQVVQTGKAVFLPDSGPVLTQLVLRRAQPIADRIVGILGTPPLIVAPLKAGGNVRGTLSVAGEGLTDEDVPAVEAFAHHISVALENARLFAALRASEEQYRVLVENAGETIVVAQDGMIKFVNPRAQRYMGFTRENMESRPFIELVHPEDRAAVMERYRKRLRGEDIPEVYTFRVVDKKGNVHWVEAKGTLMEWEGRPASLSFMSDVTEQVLAEEAVKHLADQRRRLLEISQDLQATLSVRDVVHRVLRALDGVLRYDMCGVYWIDEEAGVLVPYMIVGSGPVAEGLRKTPIPLGKGITGAVLESGVGELVNNSHLDPRSIYADGTYVAKEHLISIPVRARGRTLAVFNIARTADPPFTEEEFDLVQLFVAHASIAIQNAQLFEEVQQRAHQLAALNQVASAITATLDFRERLQAAVDTTLEITGMEAGGVALWNPDEERMEVAAARNVPAVVVEEYSGPIRPGGLRHHALSTAAPQFIEDYLETEREPTSARIEGFRGIAVIPLRLQERVLGLFVVGSRSPHRWTEEEKDLLGNIADQLAVAIENARLYEETRKQAERVQQILDTAPEGIIVLDANHHIELANPIARQVMPLLTSGSPGDVLTHLGGRPIAELLTPHSEGLPHEITVAGPPPRIFEVTANPLKMRGEAGGWVLLCRDVTEERAVQDRIREHERLAAVGQLAAGIAHDFNNLLQGIIGFSELLQQKPNVDPGTRRILAMIHTQGQRAAQLVRQILDFSRRSVVDRQPLDLLPLLKETVHLLEQTLPEHIRISLEYEPRPYVVKADATRLQQVLTNLALNARDAMPNGGTLQFKLSWLTAKPGDSLPLPEMRPGNWVALAVSDTGVGMPEEVLSHIFEPFFTTKEVGQGSGLGLAQVYGIVRQHEGYIDVKSQVGQGTTFTFYLPAWVQERGSDAPRVSKEDLLCGSGELILLVDDNAMVRQVGQAMLEELGYRVTTARDGAEALELFKEHGDEIALVVSDIVMPEMGGMDLARALHKRQSGVGVVLITGYPLGREGDLPPGDGIVGWIQKPLSLDRLAEVVQQGMEAGRARARMT